jgi:hypothetical protein
MKKLSRIPAYRRGTFATANLGVKAMGPSRQSRRQSYMKVNKVRFDGQTFLLDPEQGLDETKRAIVAAARGGADFVDFRTVGHGTISLLITSTLPVRFEVIERSEDELEQLEAHPAPLDQPPRFYDYDVDLTPERRRAG